MTSPYERRIRKLEAQHGSAGSSVVVLGSSGWPEPTHEDISQAALVLRVSFIAAKDGRPVEGESHAQH